MDYLEEQKIEIEAIESIYPEEYNLLSSDPFIFTIFVKSETAEEDEDGLFVTLKFQLKAKYPEEMPEIIALEDDKESKVDTEPYTNLEPEDIESLTNLLTTTAAENTGMAMIFTLVSAALEWLNTKRDEIINEAEMETQRKLQKIEEEERKKFEGTRVTEESFKIWKDAFDLENLEKNKEIEEKNKGDNKKLTGRELFQMKLVKEEDMEEGEVQIDESLFEDLDDLDIDEVDDDDDDEDDEDYVPESDEEN